MLHSSPRVYFSKARRIAHTSFATFAGLDVPFDTTDLVSSFREDTNLKTVREKSTLRGDLDPVKPIRLSQLSPGCRLEFRLGFAQILG